MQADRTDTELLIERSFAAPAALVFALWSRPEHMVRWMGPHDFDCPMAELDFRVGGRYRVLIRSAVHGENWFHGVYREIEQDRRLVFTFAWDNTGPSAGLETLISITLTEQDGRTLQRFHQAKFDNRDQRDRHAEGWSQTFDKLARAATQLSKEHAR